VGGSNTTSGLLFEDECDFLTLLEAVPGYHIQKRKKDKLKDTGCDVLFDGKIVAHTFKKHAFYRYLEDRGVDWKSKVSAKLLPDDAIIVITRKTLNIIEVKFQNVAGSVDEKLQTCDFKRKQYQKLVSELDLAVAYIYVLNSAWFNIPKYKDVLDYIQSVNCNYCFDKLPLEWLGLPTKENTI
jgi:hypothetical protein